MISALFLKVGKLHREKKMKAIRKVASTVLLGLFLTGGVWDLAVNYSSRSMWMIGVDIVLILFSGWFI